MSSPSFSVDCNPRKDMIIRMRSSFISSILTRFTCFNHLNISCVAEHSETKWKKVFQTFSFLVREQISLNMELKITFHWAAVIEKNDYIFNNI